MTLTYKNNAVAEILNQNRNVRYANAQMHFGFYNNITIELRLVLDAQQLFNQADVFAREILTHRSLFDMKRFLGSYQDDWTRLLIEAYAYDRLKAIYYGLNSRYMMEFPKDLVSFPGNVLLANILKQGQYNFTINDTQPFSLYVKISNLDVNFRELFEPIFEICPNLRAGLSDARGAYSYVSSIHESILKGLANAKKYMQSSKNNNKKNGKSDKKINNDLFYVSELVNDQIVVFTLQESNPIINSFLNEGGDRFYFILPTEDSKPEALRFNESLFFSRAVGFRGDQLTIDSNNYYKVAERRDPDFLTREEVYSITGLKSEMVPLSMEQIRYYLGINSYMSQNGTSSNGGTVNPPS
jgi:hypothetical protein